MKAPDIMTEQVRTVRADEPVAIALELLAATEARHLPVVSEGGEIEGILSDRDLRGLLGRYDEDPESFAEAWNSARMPVRAVMTRDPITVDLDTDVEDIVALLVDEKIGALPVVDSDKGVIGIITYIDVLRAWQREHEAIGVPVLLPTRADLHDRARAGRGEQAAVPAGTARIGRAEASSPSPRRRVGEAGSRGTRITLGARRITSQKAAPKRAASKVAAPGKAAPKKAAPGRAAPKKTTSTRGAARQR